MILLRRYIFLLLPVFMVVNCGSDEQSVSDSYNEYGKQTANYNYEEADMAYDEEMMDEVAMTVSSQSVAPAPQLNNRVIIRTGYVELIVDDPEKTMDKLGRQAEAIGGWVVESQLSQAYNDQTRKRATITLRVPSEQLQQVIEGAKEAAVDVINENSSGRDVTDEFVDLTAQLDNLRATEQRVQLFLDDTANVEEALAVNQELSRLQGQIEMITGRLKYLRESADYSSVTIDLVPDSDTRPIQIASWKPQGTVRHAIEFLLHLLQWSVDALIWVVIIGIPLLLILLLVRWLLHRLWSMIKPRWSVGRNHHAPNGEDEVDNGS